MRFLAALYIITFHLESQFFGGAPEFVREFFRRGGGVVFFYFLSGFMLTLAYGGRRRIDVGAFWLARFSRLYPAYLLALLVAAPLYFGGATFTDHGLPGELKKALGALAVLTMTQAWTPMTSLIWNAPAWSISAEAFFFVLFPFVVLPLVRLRERSMAIVMLVLWIASISLSLTPNLLMLLGLELTTSWKMALTYNPLLRLPEFLSGVMLGGLYLRFQRWHSHRVTVALFGALAVCAGFALGELLPAELVTSNLYIPVFASVTYLAAAGAGGALAHWLALPVAQLLGRASYAMIMLHIPLWLWLRAASSVLPGTEDYVDEFPVFLGYLVVVIVSSLVVHVGVEEPCRRWIRGHSLWKSEALTRPLLKLIKVALLQVRNMAHARLRREPVPGVSLAQYALHPQLPLLAAPRDPREYRLGREQGQGAY